MNIVGIAVPIGILVGIVMYIICCRLDNRARGRDAFMDQLELAAEKLGTMPMLADLIEEIQCPDASPSSRVTTPTDWRCFSLAYSDYLVIPRSFLRRQPNMWCARFMQLLNKMQASGYSDVRYTTTMRDPVTRLFLKNP